MLILAPVIDNRKGEHRDQLESLLRQGYGRVRIDGVVQEIENVQTLAKNKKHTIDAVVDRLVIKSDPDFAARLTDSAETALKLGKGRLIIHVMEGEDMVMSEGDPAVARLIPNLTPTLFSFNAPQGMCPECNGICTQLTMDVDKLVPDNEPSPSARAPFCPIATIS